MKTLTPREKQAVTLCAAAVALFCVIEFWPARDVVDEADANVAMLERSVTKLRRMSASLPGREEAYKKLAEELARHEKGMLVAETAAQAQAQLLQIARRVGQAQQPALVFKGTDFGAPKPLGDAYGEVTLTLQVDSGIEQIVNFLTDLGNQSELISVTEVQFAQVATKQKTVPVRITLAGVVARKLVPEKKGGTAF